MGDVSGVKVERPSGVGLVQAQTQCLAAFFPAQEGWKSGSSTVLLLPSRT
ncbi:MAG: hypothetical protein HYX22_02120 [Candidatus Yanofskybacteria bacterium]|nr:hypothetical protein [Candidatus Yanofskybacteria bacterium]